MYTLAELLARNTSFQQGHPRYSNFLKLVLQPQVDAANLAASLPQLFDLDVAVGVQLDAVGLRVGQSRIVQFPLVSPYFAWDQGDARGWDRAPWKGPFDDPHGYGALDDETYRRLLRARAKANTWDGTVVGAQDILDTFFIDPDTHVFIQDGGLTYSPVNYFAWDTQNQGWDQVGWNPEPLTWDGDELGWGQGYWSEPESRTRPLKTTVVVSGKIPPIIDLALLDGGNVPPKPGGVSVEYVVTTVDEAPVFGWDVDNEFIGGWGNGAWGATPDYVATQLSS